MGSPSIQFTSIPSNVRKPGVFFEENTSNAIQGLTAANDLVCILAQRLSSGTVAAKVPTKVFSDADAQLYFGAGSVAHLAARNAILANTNVDLTVVGIDDANGSAQAAGSITVGSVPSTGGTLYVWIGDVMATISYKGTDSAPNIVTKTITAFSQYSNLLPVTLTANSNTLQIEAKNGGTVGNMIPISTNDKNGITWLTTSVMSGGSGDPDVGVYSTSGTVLNSVVAGGYTVFVNTIPCTAAAYDSASKIGAMVDFVSGPLEQRPAIQVFALTDLIDTYANAKVLAGTNLNDGRATMAYINYASDNLAKTEYFKIAGAFAGDIASNSDPAVPYDGLVLSAIAPPAIVDRLTRTQQEDLLNNGVTPLYVIPGEQVAIVRAISTYVTNNLALPDPTLLDITTIRTLDFVRAQIRTRLSIRFQRAKLSPRILKSIKAEVIDVLYLLQTLEIVQNVDTYKAGVIVEVDTSDNTRADVKVPSNIVSGLHVIAGVIALIL